MRIFCLLVFALLVVACQPAGSDTRSFAPNTGQVVTAETPQEQLRACMHFPEHNARWTPTENDISTLNPVLIELIEYRLMEDNLTYGDSAEMRPEQYHRFYVGLEREGWRFIHVCGRYEATPAYILDGGPTQFAALYDTRLQKFEWFEFGYRA
jgi:hypothetical protein